MLEDDSNIILFWLCMKAKVMIKKTYPKLVLNRLKVMGGPIAIYTQLGT
jgi:hypothetical protein